VREELRKVRREGRNKGTNEISSGQTQVILKNTNVLSLTISQYFSYKT
jgi:hypothetical protein